MICSSSEHILWFYRMYSSRNHNSGYLLTSQINIGFNFQLFQLYVLRNKTLLSFQDKKSISNNNQIFQDFFYYCQFLFVQKITRDDLIKLFAGYSTCEIITYVSVFPMSCILGKCAYLIYLMHQFSLQKYNEFLKPCNQHLSIQMDKIKFADNFKNNQMFILKALSIQTSHSNNLF